MSNCEKTSEELIELVLDRFMALAQPMRHLQTKDWLCTDLTMPQIKILFLLWDQKSARVGSLAGALGVTQPTMTGILDRLVEHGLVRRQESPEDRRLVLNCLTESGLELAARLRETSRARLVKVVRHLSPDDLALVAEALDKLRQAADEESRSQS
ncbi:MAG: MarR family transcriptional regulator [Chloroflexota bacterium]|nr:MAG: MarR family transcriptional regulator [Chloroflexota bacterium]